MQVLRRGPVRTLFAVRHTVNGLFLFGMQVEIGKDFGYVVLVALMLYVQQAWIFVIPVAIQRNKTKILPPTLYPRDSEIKELKLSPGQVKSYLSAQRVHQNNVEFLVAFWPLFLIAGVFFPLQASIAGFVVFLGRLCYGIGYWIAPPHSPVLYLVYLNARIVYFLLKNPTQ